MTDSSFRHLEMLQARCCQTSADGLMQLLKGITVTCRPANAVMQTSSHELRACQIDVLFERGRKPGDATRLKEGCLQKKWSNLAEPTRQC